MAQPWDAFISYARTASTREAEALQHGIETFAKAWNQLRGCRVFRDDTSMSANSGLWPTIERALRESRYLILLLSPAAAASEYLNNEVSWWIEHKTVETILLVRNEGFLAWDRTSNDFAAETDCVPTALRGAFPDEPRWVDFSWFGRPGSLGKDDRRFPEVVADLAAPIRNVERDELIGANVSQLRKSNAWRRAGVSVLTILLVVAIIAAVVAVKQRNEIARQSVTLQSRQLASLANSFESTDVQRSQLFAVAAVRVEDSQETRSALLRALISAPALQGFQTLPADIRILQVGRGGKAVAVALENGAVYRIDPTRQAPPTLLFDMGQRVVSLSLSANGSTVAAVGSNSTVKYWRNGSVRELPIPADKSALLVAVSPNGLSILVNGPFAEGAKEGSPGLDFFDATTGVRSFRRVDPHSGPQGDFQHLTFEAAFIDDTRITLTDSSLQWAVMRIADGALLQKGGIYWSDHSTTLTRGGLWYVHHSAIEGESVDVWTTQGKGDEGEAAVAPLSARVHYASVEDIDVTEDGRWLVVSDSTGILIARTETPSGDRSSREASRRLTGVPAASQVAFLASSTRVISTSGRWVAFWDTASLGRLVAETGLAPQIPYRSVIDDTDYNNVKVALSPDGNSYATLNLHTGVIQRGSLPGRTGVPQDLVSLSADGNPFQEAMGLYWIDNQNLALLGSNVPEGGPGWLREVVIEAAASLGVSQDRRIAVAFNYGERATVARYELPSGRRLSQMPYQLQPEWSVGDAAVSTDGSVVGFQANYSPGNGFNTQSKLVFVDSSTGSVLHEVTLEPSAGDALIAIDGMDAVVQFGSDHAELWKNLGRDGREAFGQDLLPRAPISVQKQSPAFHASQIALTTMTDTKLYVRDGLAEIGSLPAPAGRTAFPRVTLFSVDGQRLLTAYLGPTEATARMTSVALDVETQRARACATSGRQLTETEWTRLVGAGTTPDLVCE